MGKGDKKSKKGKISIGSYGNSRRKKQIKERIKRVTSRKKSVVAADAKPKAKRVVKKKEGAE